jgi:hypothetical protein
MKNFDSNNSPLEEEFLQALEQYWGFGLPKDYKNFLLKFNGGVPNKNYFYFKDSDFGSQVDYFFGVKKDENFNLLMNIKMYEERIPQNFIPIADDPGGNLVLISVKGPDRGKVYFWDHEMEADEGEKPDYSNLTLIADSFDEFINSLHELEDVQEIEDK